MMTQPLFACPTRPRFALRRPLAARKRCRGFTLIETALALGIVAFALVPLIGLLPLGLQVSRNASDLTISAQIAQRLSGMIREADFSTYTTLEGTYYYFDGDGQPILANTVNPPPAVYSACILPPPAKAPSPASLADSAAAVTLRIQIANDPGQSLQGTPVDLLDPQVDPRYRMLRARTITIPLYFANNGS